MNIKRIFLGFLSTVLIIPFVTFAVCGLNTHSADFGSSNTNKTLTVDAYPTGLTRGGAITIEFWVNITTDPGTDVEYDLVLENEGNVTPYISYFVSYNDNAGTKELRFHRAHSGIADAYISVAQTLTAGTWYLIAYTYDGTNGQGYLNGSSIVGPTAQSGDGNGGSDLVSIGGWVANGKFSSGIIDDVRIYSVALGSSQLSTDYSAPSELGGSETNLVGYWTLDNTLNDKTSNANNLTNNNSVTFSTNVPFVGTACGGAAVMKIPDLPFFWFF